MTDDDERMQALERAQTAYLLGRSAALYEEILGAIRESIRRDGSGDLVAFAQRVNAALVAFKPCHRDIRAMLSDVGEDKPASPAGGAET